jgi:putative endonuclease
MSRGVKKTKKRRQISDKKCYVYILVSLQNNKRTYVGVTDNLQRRIRQHNGFLAGGARYTKSCRPWKIDSIFQLLSRRDALSLEWNIKHRRRQSDGTGVQGRIATAVRIGDRYKGFKIIQ